MNIRNELYPLETHEVQDITLEYELVYNETLYNVRFSVEAILTIAYHERIHSYHVYRLYSTERGFKYIDINTGLIKHSQNYSINGFTHPSKIFNHSVVGLKIKTDLQLITNIFNNREEIWKKHKGMYEPTSRI